MSTRRILAGIFVVLFAWVVATAGTFLWEGRAELRNLQATGAKLRQTLEAKEQELQRQETRLARLRQDPDFVARELRLQMGYARPDEVVFKFEGQP